MFNFYWWVVFSSVLGLKIDFFFCYDHLMLKIMGFVWKWQIIKWERCVQSRLQHQILIQAEAQVKRNSMCRGSKCRGIPLRLQWLHQPYKIPWKSQLWLRNRGSYRPIMRMSVMMSFTMEFHGTGGVYRNPDHWGLQRYGLTCLLSILLPLK